MKYDFKEFLSRYNDEVENLSLFHLLKEIPWDDKSSCWLAGGAIRRTILNKSLEEADFDFFFKDEESLISFQNDLENDDFIKVSENEKNITYSKICEDGTKIKLQCIFFQFYETIEDVIDSFDFTITQFAYDGKDMYCGEYSLFDLTRGKLALHKLTFGVATVRRLIKYTQQGFTACGGCLTDILQKVVEDPSIINSETKYID